MATTPTEKNTSITPNGVAFKKNETFRMECGVCIDINANPGQIWGLLTNAADFPRWNSTIQSIEGTIAKGEKIKLVATIAPDRTFKIKIAEFDPPKKMVWKDGFAPMFQGIRTFTLTPQANGTTRFLMEEVFSGLMLPMIKGSLPDFGPAFETYAADLKKEAEK